MINEQIRDYEVRLERLVLRVNDAVDNKDAKAKAALQLDITAHIATLTDRLSEVDKQLGMKDNNVLERFIVGKAKNELTLLIKSYQDLSALLKK